MGAIPIGLDPLLTHITEDQLQAYIMKMIPQIDTDQRMSVEFHEYYAITAVQKFMFFLDNHNSNIISVKKLAHSDLMAELLQLCKTNKHGSKAAKNQVMIDILMLSLCTTILHHGYILGVN